MTLNHFGQFVITIRNSTIAEESMTRYSVFPNIEIHLNFKVKLNSLLNYFRNTLLT